MNCVSDDATNEHQNARRAATRQPQQPRQTRDGARKRRRQTVEEAQGREQWWRAGLCWLVLACAGCEACGSAPEMWLHVAASIKTTPRQFASETPMQIGTGTNARDTPAQTPQQATEQRRQRRRRRED